MEGSVGAVSYRWVYAVIIISLLSIATMVFSNSPTADIDFVSPTPANATHFQNHSVIINVSINHTGAGYNMFLFNWNGTNYTLYNSSVTLMYNFDNVSVLGENNTNVAGLDIYRRNGTASGNAKPNASGKFRGGFSFGGSGDRVNPSLAASRLITGSAGTVSAWVKSLRPTITSGFFVWQGESIIGDDGAYFGLFFSRPTTNELYIWAYNNDGNDDQVRINITHDEWVHLAWVHSGGTLYIYKNGELLNSTASGNTADVTGNVYLGDNGYSESADFIGMIDEIKVYNISLSADQIRQLYFTDLYKFDTGKWILSVNQSNSSTTSLLESNYTYFASVQNSTGSENVSETRYLTIADAPPFSNTSAINVSSPVNMTIAVNHSARWFDDEGLRFYFFEWNGSGTHCNVVANVSSGPLLNGSNISHTSLVLNDSCAGNTISFRFWVNDSRNQWNASVNSTYDVRMTSQAPVVSSVTLSPAVAVSTESLVCGNGSVSDGELNDVDLHYSWFVNETSAALLNLPFDRTSTDISNLNNTVRRGNGSAANIPLFQATLGKTGGTFYFDDSGDFINVTDHARFNFSANHSFTIEAWINLSSDGKTDDNVVVDKREVHAGAGVELYLTRVSGVHVVTFAVEDSGNNPSARGSTGLKDSKYHHIAAVRNADNPNDKRLLVYVNGTLEVNASDTTTGSLAASTDLYIGARYNNSNGNLSDEWNGYIDELIIWNRTISAAEIAEHNASNYSVLVFNETKPGDTWKCSITPIDSTGTNNSASFSGNSTVAEVPNLRLVHSYQSDNTTRSFFSRGEVIRIRVNATTQGSTNYPRAQVLYPNGSVYISYTKMHNESSRVFFIDLIANETIGYYDVNISRDQNSSRLYKSAFYVGRTWVNKFDNSTFLYIREINVSENGTVNRTYEPVDVFIAFTKNALNSSIRVAQFNGTNYTEIPSQVYNLTQTSAGAVSRGNIVFLVTLDRGASRNYSVGWRSTSIAAPNYNTSLNITNATPEYYVRNNFYNLTLNRSAGGLLYNAVDTVGNNTSFGGASPMQFAPEAKIPTPTFTIRDYTTPNITNETGPVFVRFNVKGLFGGDLEHPYEINYTFYENSPYFKFSKNISADEANTWTSYDSELLKLKDGSFSLVRLKNSSGTIVSGSLASGTNTGNDRSGLDMNLSWIVFINNGTRDAIGDIFIRRNNSFETGPKINIFDISSDDEYQRTVISSSTSVTKGSFFTEEIARVIYDGFLNDDLINDLDRQLDNPLNATVFEQQAFDTEFPKHTSFGVTPSSPTDAQNVTCFSSWTDNVALQKVLVEENTSFSLKNNTVTISGTSNSSGNLTITAANLETGVFGCRFYGFDDADNVNATSLVVFTVSDTTPPVILNITFFPDSAAGQDPNVSVNVTANITDFGTRDTVILQYKEWNSSGNFTNTTMARLGTSDFYRANFTPDTSNNWTIRIVANDTSGNTNTSTDQNVSAFTDYTWVSSPANFGSNNTPLDTNLSVGLITINNTGDVSFTFEVTHNLPEPPARVFFNNTATLVTAALAGGEVKHINLTVTGASTERDDAISVTIDATNSTASPSYNTSNVTVVSFESGPFLLVEIIEYPATVTQGDTGKKLSAKLTNKGNETATNTSFAWELPSGWTTDDTKNITVTASGNLTVDNHTFLNVTVSISSSAPTGSQTITARASCCNDSSKMKSKSQAISVGSLGTTTTTTTSSGGGGGGGTALTEERQKKLFQSEQVFELIRGLSREFTVTIENSFDAVLHNVTINVSGFISNRISLSRYFFGRLEENESVNVTVYIEAPEYLPVGRTELVFTVSGVAVKGLVKNDIVSEKRVTLLIQELSTEEAEGILNKMRLILAIMKTRGFSTDDMEGLYSRAELLFSERDFEGLESLGKDAEELYDAAATGFTALGILKYLIAEAEADGLPIQQTSRLLSLAVLAFERGDFPLAKSRADESLLTFGLETKGEFNFFVFFLNNWVLITAASLAGMAAFSGSYYKARIYIINREMESMRKEEFIVKGLMAQVQKECFEEGKMSIDEYEHTMDYYRSQLSRIIQNRVRLEAEKAGIIMFSKTKSLHVERDKLLELMKKTQEDYLLHGRTETSAYMSMMESISKRLAVVEEHLTVREARAKIRKNAGRLSI